MPTPPWSRVALLGPDAPLPTDRPFTYAEALAEGVGSKLLTQLVRSGHLRHVLHGVYVATQVPDSLRMRVRALKLVVPDHGVVVDRTACWLHVVDALPRRAAYEMPPLEVYSTAASRTRRDGVASGIRELRPVDIEVIDGLRVTTKLRTACDVGRLVWRYDAIGALDGLVRAGLSRDELVDAVARFTGHRGVRQLRQLVPIIDPLAESMPESALRFHWHESDLPWPECQIWVHDDDGRPVFRIDIGHREVRYGAGVLRGWSSTGTTRRRRTRPDSPGSDVGLDAWTSSARLRSMAWTRIRTAPCATGFERARASARAGCHHATST